MVAPVDALHRIVASRQIADGARERPEMIEAGDKRKRARARQPAIGRFQTKYAAERRWHADRAVGVGAKRQWHKAAADRRARAARRAAAHVAEIVGIARRTVVRVLAGEVVGVFAHVQRADQDGARRLELLDQRRIRRRRLALAIDLGAGAGRQAGDVKQVLDRERRAGERPERLAAGAGGVDRVGLGERARAP